MALLIEAVLAKAAGVKAVALGVSFTVSALLAEARFSHTITLGAVIITIAIGIGTIVSLVYGVRYRSINRVLDSEVHVFKERCERLEHDMSEYREAKHRQIAELTGQVRKCQGDLEMERQKHDFTAVQQRLELIDEELRARTALFEQIISAQTQQAEILQQVAATLETVASRLAERG